ncbi:MAG: BrxE family protein, partial [Planctomycetota bacterium]
LKIPPRVGDPVHQSRGMLLGRFGVLARRVEGTALGGLLVAALGERVSEPWWKSQFLTPTGMNIGNRIFPRSTGVAALSSATVAARRDHDDKTGLRSFHLFRLPSSVEHQLVDVANELTDWSLPDEPSDIVQLLQEMSEGSDVKFSKGPKSLGKVTEINKASTPRAIASLYAASIAKNQRVYPYFEAAEDE